MRLGYFTMPVHPLGRDWSETLREDRDENKELYGRSVSNKQIVDGAVMPPESANALLELLNKYSRQG